MKTFTTYAEKKAKQFLNLLQGYTKGIRLTAILILLLMGVNHAWADIAFSGGYIYFDNSIGINQTYIQLCARQGSWTGVSTMTNISNTKLYYVANPQGSGWGGILGWVVIGNSTAKSNSNFDNWTSYGWCSNWNEYGFYSGSTYLIVPTSTSKSQSVNTSHLGGGYDDLNSEQTINTVVDGTVANSKATISLTSYKMTGNGAVTKQEATHGTGSKDSYISAARTATTTFTVGDVEAGYQFDGWYTAATDGTQLSKEKTYTYYPTAATTVYARFSTKQHKVNFGVHSSGHGSLTAKVGDTGISSGNRVNYGSEVVFTAEPADGYQIEGWYKNSDCTTSLNNGTLDTYSVTVTTGTNVYVKFEAIPANSHNITYTTQGTGWTYGNSNPTTAEEGATVTFVVNPTAGYRVSVSSDGPALTGPNANNQYTFTMPTKDVKITVDAKPEQYTVTLDKQSGTGGPASVTATYLAAMPTITPPTRTGYTFNGYFDATSGGTKYYDANGSSAKNWDKTSNTTLYAQWTAKQYTITYNTNGGNSIANKTYTIETATFNLPTPTKTGHTFIGWFDNEELTGNAVTQITKGSTGDKTYWAKWEVASYTVTFDAEGGNGGTTTLTVQYGAQLPNITIPTKDGHLFLGYYNGDNGTGTQYYDASGKGLYTMPAGNLTLYAKWLDSRDCIFFYNNLGWSNVYVYFYSSDKYWDDYMGTGSQKEKKFPQDGDAEHKPHYREYRGKMTKIEGTNIWYYNRTVHGDITRDNYSNVAFTKDQRYDYEWFWQTEVVRRGDYNSNLPMFVSMKADGAKKNESTYYNNGYWMNYPTNTGYELHIWDANGNTISDQLANMPFEFSENIAMPLSINVRLEAATTYSFKFERADGQWFGNNGKMTTGHSGDAGQTAWEFTTGTNNCKITTTAAGIYVFTLKYGKDANKNYNYLLGVEYPTGVGDYRLAYKDNAHPLHPGHALKHRADGKDTVSFFVHHNLSPVIMLQKVTNIDANTGAITWGTLKTYALTANQPVGDNPNQAMIPGRRNADEIILHIGDEHMDGIDDTGIYNFVLEQTASEAALQDVATKYTGNFYIRTNAAAGGWVDFRQKSNQITYSSFADKHSNFNHYYCKYIEAGSNVKFTIANDYSYCISDTLDNDDIIEKGQSSEGCLPDKANVRFGWDSNTNEISRAYIKGAGMTSDRFLVLQGNEHLKDANGNAIPKGTGVRTGLEANEEILVDQQNWIYQVDVTANKYTEVKLIADYNGTTQYFKGSDTESTGLLSSTASKDYKIRLVYDFKSNHLVIAWLAGGTVTNTEILGADMMVIRRDQQPAEQLNFNPQNSSMTDVKTGYSVMTFTKDWITGTATERERSLYWVSFPFNVKISDVFGFGEYAEHWILQYYDGAERAEKGLFSDSGTYWKYIFDTNTELEAGKGYVLVLDLSKVEFLYGATEVSLYFPSTNPLTTITGNLPTAATVPAHWCNIDREFEDGGKTYNHKFTDSHWNLIGVPGFADINNFNDGDYHFMQEDVSFYYKFDLTKSIYTVEKNYTVEHATNFQAMYSYMVQFAGTIYWMSKTVEGVTPTEIAARRYSDDQPEKVALRLELAQGEEVADRTFIQLQQEGATANFDLSLDLTKIVNIGVSNIYTLTDSLKIQTAGNVLPFEETTVAVGVDIATAGEYTFRMPDGTEGMVVELIDYETNTTTNLLLDDYTVNLPAGSNETRFALSLKPEKTATSIESTTTPSDSNIRKFIIDGKLYLQKDGMLYDAQGHIVR